MISILTDLCLLVALYYTIVQFQQRINDLRNLIWAIHDTMVQHKTVIEKMTKELEELKKANGIRTE